MFVNGVQDGSSYTDSSNYGTNKPIRIGDDTAGNNHFIGYIDEFRVSTTARYTAAFTALQVFSKVIQTLYYSFTLMVLKDNSIQMIGLVVNHSLRVNTSIMMQF